MKEKTILRLFGLIFLLQIFALGFAIYVIIAILQHFGII